MAELLVVLFNHQQVCDTAADGIKSVVRSTVVGDAAFSTARPSGLSAFRFTLQADAIENAIGELPEFLDPDKPVCLSMVHSFDGTKRSIVMYPCRDFQLLNFVCIVPDEMLKTETTESWTAAGDKDELLSIFADFPPWVLNYLKYDNFLRHPPPPKKPPLNSLISAL